MAWSSLLCCTQSEEVGERDHETGQKLYGLHSVLRILSQLADIEMLIVQYDIYICEYLADLYQQLGQSEVVPTNIAVWTTRL